MGADGGRRRRRATERSHAGQGRPSPLRQARPLEPPSPPAPPPSPGTTSPPAGTAGPSRPVPSGLWPSPVERAGADKLTASGAAMALTRTLRRGTCRRGQVAPAPPRGAQLRARRHQEAAPERHRRGTPPSPPGRVSLPYPLQNPPEHGGGARMPPGGGGQAEGKPRGPAQRRPRPAGARCGPLAP